MRIMMEIRPGEGGDDAKQLVKEQAAIYNAFATRNGLQVDTEVQGHL